MTPRVDYAVVLARGSSSRMGRPKGLCRATSGGSTCLEAVAGLYRAAGLPLAVVTTPQLARLYEPLLAGGAPLRWIVREAGQDTAASVAAALTELAACATHLWLHPVDLPDVRAATLMRLAEASRLAPLAVLVPAHQGERGHPVVLPCEPFADLRGTWPAGPMRDLLRERAECGDARAVVVRDLPVDDPGVAADRDGPQPRRAAAAPADGEVGEEDRA